MVRDERDAVVVLNAASLETSSPSLSVGTRRPAYASVLGRVLLCELTDAELAELYPELELPHVGIGSPRSLAELKQLLYEDLGRGYTVGDSLVDQDISGVAAPVRAPDGEFVAAVGVTVCKSILKQWALRDWLVQEVLAAAAEIADGLSHRRRPGQGTAHREPRTVRAARERGDASVPA